KMLVPVTAEEKTNKKNDVKARSLLLMAFPMNINLLSVNTVMLKQCLPLSKHDLELPSSMPNNFCLPVLTITLSLPVGTTYLPAGTFTLLVNLRYLEDKPNVQGLGHEWYFDLDYLTDSLGYTRFKTLQPAGTQDTNIHAGTQDDSDSKCDEQVIVVPSFPSNSFSGPKVNEASKVVESSSDYVEELARLQKQAYEANATAEKHLSQADQAASRNGVPAGKVDFAAAVSDGSTDTSTPVFKPVPTDATSLSPGHSLGSSAH
ncbi:hypothetical protein Tco_1578922, partial [Tanacetum coccineum]